ncbi:MAG: OmpA family protein, partial [Paracoccaceae bacterium]
ADADAAATAAAAQAEADAAAAQAAAQAEADAAAQAAAEAAAQAESAAEPAVEAPVAEAPSVEDTAAQPEAPTEDASAAPAADPVAETAPETAADAAPDAVAETTPDSAPVAEVAPVDVPEVSTEAAASLSDILAAPTVTEEAEATDADATADPSAPAEVPMAVAAAGAAEATAEGGADPSAAPVSKDMAPVAVVSEVVTEDNTRTSDEEFAAAPVAVAAGKKSGLSDLEKVGLLALGALVVGAVINEGKKDQKKVVSNSGDRVVVENPDGSYVVYKDDDAILRRPGVETRTETYRDGSTRTVVQRTNGTEVVTIRDASGRVLRRATYDQNGNEMILIDDLAPEERIDITKLPRPKPGRVTISSSGDDAVLKAQLAAIEADSLGRKFSLRQIREIREVRALSATIEVDSITFDSGSAAIKATEARKLADIGQLIEQLLAANPREVFLIEGHTDAVGSAPSNLALSDRRAESLALALTEYFQIPPENLVVQGYGEAELKVETDDDERKNRRVVVRLITPLMRTAELR